MVACRKCLRPDPKANIKKIDPRHRLIYFILTVEVCGIWLECPAIVTVVDRLSLSSPRLRAPGDFGRRISSVALTADITCVKQKRIYCTIIESQFNRAYLFRDALSVLLGRRRSCVLVLDVNFVEPVADQHVDLVAGRPESVDGLLVRGAEQALAVDLDDPLADDEAGLGRRDGALVDLGDEHALVGLVQRVARLALKAALDHHAQFLAGELLDQDFLK